MALKLNKNNYFAWFNKGLTLILLNNLKNALICFEKVIEINKDWEEGWSSKGFVLSTLGKHKEAVEYYKKSLEINPDTIEVLVNIVNPLNELKNHEEALKFINRAIELNPNLAKAYVNKAGTLGFLKKFEEAVVLYDKALSLEPNNPKFWHNKGLTLEKLNNITEALQCFDKSIILDANFPDSWFRLGFIYGKKGDHEKELTLLNNALKIDPNHAESLVLKSSVLGILRRYKEANVCSKRALEFKPEDDLLWNYRGYILLMLNEPKEALFCFNKAIGIDPNNVLFYRDKGIAYYDLNQFNDAIIEFNKALEINPDLDDLWAFKAQTLSKLNKHEAAVECCERSLVINPLSIKALDIMGIILSFLNKNEEAIEYYKQAVELDPKGYGILSNLGISFAELGNFNKAIEYLHRAIEINPEFIEAYSNLGAIYLDKHDYDSARDYFGKAKNLSRKQKLGDHAKKSHKLELWAINAKELVARLNNFDRDFLNSLYSKDMFDLYVKSKDLSKRIDEIANEFKRRELPKDALDLLQSKKACIKILKKSLEFKATDFSELDNAKAVFLRWKLNNLISLTNSLKEFCISISDFESLETIPKEKQLSFLEIINKFQILDGYLTEELKNQVQSKKTTIESKIFKIDRKIDFIHIKSNSSKDYLRICLVQIDYNLSKSFPYKLEKKDFVSGKIIKALKIAQEDQVDIICYPELSFDEGFLEKMRKYKGFIKICGTYYDDENYNLCNVIYNDDEIKIRKINPSPYLEDKISIRNGMNRGNEIKIFEINENIRFTILICMDFYYERSRLINYEYNGRKGVDFIFVPSYNDNIERFQKTADAYCYNNKTDIIKVSNTGCITCIFGPAHKSLLERLKNEKFRNEDQFTYKLCEVQGEMIMIVDLYPTPTHVPTHLGAPPRINRIKRFEYKNNNWEEI